jgi:sRNA-binding regulator protein Hfq
MIPEAILSHPGTEDSTLSAGLRRLSTGFATPAVHLHSRDAEFDAAHPQAEVFYLQKQIQSQTPMVIVLIDGERVEGCIEWYDNKVLKVRGKTRTLVYKSSVKYMYKLAENGQ